MSIADYACIFCGLALFACGWMSARRARSAGRDAALLRRDMALIGKAAEEFASALEFDVLLPAAAEVFAKAAHARKVSVFLPNRRTGFLEIRAGIGLSARAKDRVRLRPGEGLAGRAFASGIPIWSGDLPDDPEYREFSKTSPRPSGGMLALPVLHKGRGVGCICVEYPDYRGGRASSSPADFRALEILLHQCAGAIQNAILYEEAATDELTGLFGPRYFRRRLAREFEKAVAGDGADAPTKRSLGLVILDVDHFKNINDSRGHPVGDLALAHMGRILKRACERKAGHRPALPARYGGEEFAVIMSGAGEKDALEFAEHVRGQVEKHPLALGTGMLHMTVSAGVAAADFRDGAVPEVRHPRSPGGALGAVAGGAGMLEKADRALYEAKRSGRNKVCVCSPHFNGAQVQGGGLSLAQRSSAHRCPEGRRDGGCPARHVDNIMKIVIL